MLKSDHQPEVTLIVKQSGERMRGVLTFVRPHVQASYTFWGATTDSVLAQIQEMLDSFDE